MQSNASGPTVRHGAIGTVQSRLADISVNDPFTVARILHRGLRMFFTAEGIVFRVI
ncbi:MAG: hypothetical protein Q8P46_08015 [Hyphomicrobiales bacterium]|jgi:hypothetical protein|nr:hypothetical protein [Hyphomicrobiales bacterium]